MVTTVRTGCEILATPLEAVVYALCRVGLEDFTLKPKQEEALIHVPVR